ncbi:MAG: CotH kinase family protein [Christensenellales bacterium]|nr:CotH kinase family protein [Christensenellales bacterium]
MKRLKLLAAMLALCAVLAAAVVMGSSYAPVLEPMRPIEEIWALEDARQASEGPLVTALEMDGQALAYDAQSRTFYCTLGLEQGEAWPSLHLTAPGVEGVSLCFVDDYTYDACADAIREGYAYEAMAYTDTAYDYFRIVFTGLPLLSIDTKGQTLTTEDVPVCATMTAYGEETLCAEARIHLRGASTLLFEKQSYKLELTRSRNGRISKIDREVPGFGIADDLALLPCLHDETKMRDRMGWDIWNELTADDEPFGGRRTGYVEVFKDQAYHGLYLMVEPVDVEEELALAGEMHLLTDSVYRTAALNFSREREYVRHPLRENAGYELYYAPSGTQRTEARFAALRPYMELLTEDDDEAFAARAMSLIDVDSMLRHVLLTQGCGMVDNVFNNMYIWAQPGACGAVTYRFAPWDMDMSWGRERDVIGEEFDRWVFFPVADRLLNLDAGGIRQRAYAMWQAMRADVLSMERLEERIQGYAHELADSGAMLREAERWGSEATYPDGYELTTFAAMRWTRMDAAMEKLMNTVGPVDFLSASNYAAKAGGALPTPAQDAP